VALGRELRLHVGLMARRSAQNTSKIFRGHVFDTVLSEIPQDWGLGAFQ
jgi:hypothetical protein